jgi:FMN phosphatase YigB (HAD superfamily)
MKRKAWIFDVDGTLANVDSILHYVQNINDLPEFKKDFDKFHGESINVPPHKEVVDMLWEMAENHNYDIIVVTARREEWRAHTSFWLKKNLIPHDALFMRGNKDFRPDYEIKKDILEHINLFWDVVHAVDDNPKVIKLWEENGISTTKIGDWDGEE